MLGATAAGLVAVSGSPAQAALAKGPHEDCHACEKFCMDMVKAMGGNGR